MMAERTRSHWGWGWADAFPDRAARAKTGQMVSMLLGGAALEPREPAPIEEAMASVAAPRVEVPGGSPLSRFVTAAPEERLRHTYGRGYGDLVRGFAGRFEAAPDLVAHPEDEDAIWALLDFAAAKKLAVVPWGGGTSVVRGTEPELAPGQRGAVSLDLSRLGRVLEVDEVSRAA
ncbi:MAG TPA: FAD-binding protein, partial [Kofleriaceae bacterium]|nr:FAD-binding protein [Kofleriaceae bacterium]